MLSTEDEWTTEEEIQVSCNVVRILNTNIMAETSSLFIISYQKILKIFFIVYSCF